MSAATSRRSRRSGSCRRTVSLLARDHGGRKCWPGGSLVCTRRAAPTPRRLTSGLSNHRRARQPGCGADQPSDRDFFAHGRWSARSRRKRCRVFRGGQRAEPRPYTRNHHHCGGLPPGGGRSYARLVQRIIRGTSGPAFDRGAERSVPARSGRTYLTANTQPTARARTSVGLLKRPEARPTAWPSIFARMAGSAMSARTCALLSWGGSGATARCARPRQGIVHGGKRAGTDGNADTAMLRIFSA